MSNTYKQVVAYIYDKKGNLLAIGRNSYVKTHPLQAKYAARVGRPKKIYLHAEIDAISRLRDPSKAHKIVLMAPLKSGGYGLAKPCPICALALQEAGITNIEYTV